MGNRTIKSNRRGKHLLFNSKGNTTYTYLLLASLLGVGGIAGFKNLGGQASLAIAGDSDSGTVGAATPGVGSEAMAGAADLLGDSFEIEPLSEMDEYAFEILYTAMSADGIHNLQASDEERENPFFVRALLSCLDGGASVYACRDQARDQIEEPEPPSFGSMGEYAEYLRYTCEHGVASYGGYPGCATAPNNAPDHLVDDSAIDTSEIGCDNVDLSAGYPRCMAGAADLLGDSFEIEPLSEMDEYAFEILYTAMSADGIHNLQVSDEERENPFFVRALLSCLDGGASVYACRDQARDQWETSIEEHYSEALAEAGIQDEIDAFKFGNCMAGGGAMEACMFDASPDYLREQFKDEKGDAFADCFTGSGTVSCIENVFADAWDSEKSDGFWDWDDTRGNDKPVAIVGVLAESADNCGFFCKVHRTVNGWLGNEPAEALALSTAAERTIVVGGEGRLTHRVSRVFGRGMSDTEREAALDSLDRQAWMADPTGTTPTAAWNNGDALQALLSDPNQLWPGEEVPFALTAPDHLTGYADHDAMSAEALGVGHLKR